MLLGNPLTVYCPQCNTPHMQMSLISGNTFGGVFWSDGCSLTPMLPDIPLFTRCVSCRCIFSLKRCEQEESEREEAYDFPPVTQPDTEGLEEALATKVYQTEQEEIYLRVRLWWAMNKRPFQTGETMAHSMDEKYLKNARKLIQLLGMNKEENLLTIAELHRNTGEFDACIKALSGIKEKRFEDRADQIKKACEAGITAVIRFT